MQRSLDETDEKIIETARELFLKGSIHSTEMKDIARGCGIGRSTLYRHFESKYAICFYIAEDIIIEILSANVEPLFTPDSTGYDKLSLKIHADVQTGLDNPDKIRFLDEFDQLLTGAYPKSDAALHYIEFNQNYHNKILDYLEEGVQDGSIRPISNISFEAEVIINTLFGLAQRIIPRSEHFKEEHDGHSSDYIFETANLLLSSVKNTKPI